MNIRPKCACKGVTDLMFCCSGAADTAEIADLAVRDLHKAKDARMFCLAGIAGDVELIVVNSQRCQPHAGSRWLRKRLRQQDDAEEWV